VIYCEYGRKKFLIFLEIVLGEAKMKQEIHFGCGIRRMELMRYLLLQTSLVRAGVKPAEILTLNHCYGVAETQDGYCLHQEEVLRRLGLPWYSLRHRESGTLTIFYDPRLLSETLSQSAVEKYLKRHGYADCNTLESWLERLAERFENENFPHEVGLFLGYPLKDVVGFISARSRMTHQGSWRIYGKKEPSLQLMDRFRRARMLAENIISEVEDWDQCVQKINLIPSLI